MNTDALIEGTVTGVTAAIIIGIWSETSEKVKDALLGRSIRKSISKFGVGSGIQGLSVTLHNRTETPVKVRGVGIVSDDAVYILNAESEIQNVWSDRKPKVGEKYTEVRIGSIFKKEESEEYPDIPPHSSRGFRLAAKLISGARFFPLSVSAVVEFKLTSGGSRIMKLESDEETNSRLQGIAEKFKQEIHDGSLDAGRKLFGLPPVKPK